MSNIEVSLENKIIILSTETIIKLFNMDNGADAVALYLFYHKQSKIQKTNQSWSISSFCKKGLKWGDKKLKKAKNILKDLNLIEDIKEIGEDGKIKKWYIKINYIKSTSGANSTPVETPPSGKEETNAGSSLKENAGSSLKEINTEKKEELALFIKKRNEKKYKEKGKFKGKNLPQVRKITKDKDKIWIKAREEYSFEEIGYAVMRYIDFIEKNDFYTHRFDCFTFLKQDNGLAKYINT